MISSARTFGAPVTDPGGKAARMRSPSPAAALSVPCTSETRCQRPGCGSAPSRRGTCTLPAVQTRLRSLRIRSTIITFSARFLAERSSSARCRRACCWRGDRRFVPLTGRDKTVLPFLRRNSSGDRLATAPPGMRMKAAYGGRRTAAARQNASSGSPSKAAASRRQMFAWKISPRRM